MSSSILQSCKELEIANCLFDMSKNIISRISTENSEFLNNSESYTFEKNDSRKSFLYNKLEKESLHIDSTHSNHSYEQKYHTMDEVKGVDIVGDLINEPQMFGMDELAYGRRILIELMDSSNRLYNWHFLDAVEECEAPFYYAKIERPMWMKKILEKFDSKHYKSILEFVEDFKLIINNAIQYNGLVHPVSKKAKKLEIMFYQKLNLLPSFIKDKFKIKEEKSPVKRFQKTKTVISAERSAIMRRHRIEAAQRNRAKKLRRIEIIKNSRLHFYETLQVWEDELMKGCSYKSLWQLPQIGLFLRSTLSSLKVEITQYELERCFLLPTQSSALAQIMTALLSTPYTRKQMYGWDSLDFDEWHAKLKTTLSPWFKTYNENAKNTEYVFQKYGIEKEFFDVFGDTNPLSNRDFTDLSYEERVWIVKSLCDYTLESQKAIIEAMDELVADNHRPTILGWDSDGREYIYFHQFIENDIRIYRQTSFMATSLDDGTTKKKFLYSSEEDEENLSSTDNEWESQNEYDSNLENGKFTPARRNLRSYNTRQCVNNVDWCVETHVPINNIETSSVDGSVHSEAFSDLLLTPRRSLRKVMEESKRDITPLKNMKNNLENVSESGREMMKRSVRSANPKCHSNDLFTTGSRSFKKKLKNRSNKNLISKLKRALHSNRNSKLSADKLNTDISAHLNGIVRQQDCKRSRKNRKSKNLNGHDATVNDENDSGNLPEKSDSAVAAAIYPEDFELIVKNLDDLKILIDYLTKQGQEEEKKDTKKREKKLLKSLENLYLDLVPFELRFQQIIKKKRMDMRREVDKYEQYKKMKLLKESQQKKQEEVEPVSSLCDITDSNQIDHCNEHIEVGEKDHLDKTLKDQDDQFFNDEARIEPKKKKVPTATLR